MGCNMEDKIIHNIEKEIEDIFFEYVAVRSDTCSKYEKAIEVFWANHFNKVEYFKNNPEHFGFYPISGDLYERNVSYALLKGTGNETVVLIHHNDVVDTEDFKTLQSLAYSPKELAIELKKISNELLQEIYLVTNIILDVEQRI